MPGLVELDLSALAATNGVIFVLIRILFTLRMNEVPERKNFRNGPGGKPLKIPPLLTTPKRIRSIRHVKVHF